MLKLDKIHGRPQNKLPSNSSHPLKFPQKYSNTTMNKKYGNLTDHSKLNKTDERNQQSSIKHLQVASKNTSKRKKQLILSKGDNFPFMPSLPVYPEGQNIQQHNEEAETHSTTKEKTKKLQSQRLCEKVTNIGVRRTVRNGYVRKEEKKKKRKRQTIEKP